MVFTRGKGCYASSHRKENFASFVGCAPALPTLQMYKQKITLEELKTTLEVLFTILIAPLGGFFNKARVKPN